MELRSLLEQYKDISLKLIDSLNSDYDSCGLLVEKREELLTYLKENNFLKDDLVSISNELELVEIDKKVISSIMIAREKVKTEIIELKKKRDANRTYGAGFKNISFLNEKI